MLLKGPHIIVGLGNPGPTYANTRHNAGFCVVDFLSRELNAHYGRLVGDAFVQKASFEGEEVVLIKPQTFMNLSGGPTKGALSRLKATPADVLVIHDELDLPPGVLRLKNGGGHGGHKGLRSLHEAIGSEYARLRVGIGRPPGRMDAADFVLSRMKGVELEEFEVTCAQAAELVRVVLKEGVLAAMNAYHASAEPSEPKPAAAPPAAPAGPAQTNPTQQTT
jgi:PTH1 family peptidyl-tRNA hydrolase